MTKKQKIYTGVAIVGLAAIIFGAYYMSKKNKLKMAAPVAEKDTMTEQEKYMAIMNQPDEKDIITPVSSNVRFTGPEIKSDILEM